jgi:hypothetical protein
MAYLRRVMAASAHCRGLPMSDEHRWSMWEVRSTALEARGDAEHLVGKSERLRAEARSQCGPARDVRQ